MPADLLIINGRVFRPHARSQPAPSGSSEGRAPAGAPTAVAVVNGRIAWVGGDRHAEEWRGSAMEVVDARGGLVMPGFDDAHIHLVSGARSLNEIDLFGLEAVEQVAQVIREGAAAHPERPWVVGRGWLYVPFRAGLPTRALLDELVPDRPALMTCYDGHTAWANTRALELAGIGPDTPDPLNGVILRDDATGQPTGALKEDAQFLIERLLPVPALDEDLASLRTAIGRLHQVGITAVQDAWTQPAELGRLRTLHDRGDLAIRARVALPMDPGQDFDHWRQRLRELAGEVLPLRGGEFLSAGILKGFVDGVIEARTAAMLAPYEDDTSTGLPNWTPEQLNAFVKEADAGGWQVELHAIGDRGVRIALDAIETTAESGPWHGDPLGSGSPPGTYQRRHRIEHIETIAAADIPRFGEIGVVASLQPYHGNPAANQADIWAGNIGAERASRAWAAGSLERKGATLAFGSDWPVVPFDPFLALQVAVNRQTDAGEPAGGWLPAEAISLPRALSAYTLGSAYAAFAEPRRGSLAVGMDGDLIVLDRDLLLEGRSAIVGTAVLLTTVAGRIVHRSGL